MNFLAALVCALAGAPCLLFLINLFAYRRLPRSVPGMPGQLPAVSFLIPARNEERNIQSAVEAVLANGGCELEVIVLDDESSDRTASVVASLASRDPRVRLIASRPLPRGWCGKQHACYTLAQLARHPLLVFLDADVRLRPDALARIAQFMQKTGVALASGVPHQQLGTFSERLLIPLIHFILLGFLPLHWMRRTRWAAMSAGCGQLFVARRDAYQACGGHAGLRNSLHDGLQLPRVFRRAGFATDLFDATDLATCRMYHTNVDTWKGLGKNATEGLAAPGTILPMSLLLFMGQVVPALLLAGGICPGVPIFPWVLVALGLAVLPRWIGVLRFQQPALSALLHPIGVLTLLAIQWYQFFRRCLGRSSDWKGRACGPEPFRRSPAGSLRPTHFVP